MRQIGFITTIFLTVLTLSTLHGGTVLFDSFTGSGTYVGGRGVCEPASGCGGYQAVAVSFQPSVTDKLQSLELALAGGGVDGHITIDLANDSSGSPGSTFLESFSYDVTSITPTLVTFTSILQPLLSSGTTYWVEIFPTQSTTGIGWEFDNTNSSGPDIMSAMGGAWTVQAQLFTPSLEVTGVPEPSSFLFAACGFLALILMPRLRNACQR